MKEVDVDPNIKLIHFPNLEELGEHTELGIPFVPLSKFKHLGKVGFNNNGQPFVFGPNDDYSVDTYDIYQLSVDSINEWLNNDYFAMDSINIALKNMTYSSSISNVETRTTYNYNIMKLEFNERDVDYGAIGIVSPVEFWQDNHTTFKLVIDFANTIIQANDPDVVTSAIMQIINKSIQKMTTRHYPPINNNNRKLLRDTPDDDDNPNNNMKYETDIDIEVSLIHEITLLCDSFPYTFRISDYNSTHDTSYIGVNTVVINNVGVNPSTEERTFTSNGNYYIYPTSPYNYIGDVLVHVNVQPRLLESGQVISSNGVYTILDNDDDNDLDIVSGNVRSSNNIGTFTVNISNIPTQTKSVSYNSNGSYIVIPDSGYNLSQVNIDVQVPQSSALINVDKLCLVGNNVSDFYFTFSDIINYGTTLNIGNSVNLPCVGYRADSLYVLYYSTSLITFVKPVIFMNNGGSASSSSYNVVFNNNSDHDLVIRQYTREYRGFTPSTNFMMIWFYSGSTELFYCPCYERFFTASSGYTVNYNITNSNLNYSNDTIILSKSVFNII